MKYWLMKSEPSEFAIDDLQQKRREMWDGIRNYQVRNMLRDEMRVGDMALFYHSNAAAETGVVGTMKVVKGAYPDPTQFDTKSAHYDPKSDPAQPRWVCVDVQFVKKFARLVSLAEIRKKKTLGTMPLVQKGNRLSVMPLTKRQYDQIVRMGENR